VVEHLGDPVSYLAALVKLLKPGGSLRVFVPNGNSLSARLFGRYSYVYWLPFHLNFFTPVTLGLALERAGLPNTECKVFSPIGSWLHSQRQLLLSPGFDRRPSSWLDRMIRRSWALNYPCETIAQWMGLGEEVIGTGRVPA
jgi:Methyltransferase domain